MTLIVALFFFGGVQLFFMGLIGEYVLAIYGQVRDNRSSSSGSGSISAPRPEVATRCREFLAAPVARPATAKYDTDGRR